MGDWNHQDVGNAPVRRATQSASLAMRLSVVLLATAGQQHVDSTLSPAPGPHARINGRAVNRTELVDWWRASQAASVQTVFFSTFSDEGSPWISQLCPEEVRSAFSSC